MQASPKKKFIFLSLLKSDISKNKDNLDTTNLLYIILKCFHVIIQLELEFLNIYYWYLMLVSIDVKLQFL